MIIVRDLKVEFWVDDSIRLWNFYCLENLYFM